MRGMKRVRLLTIVLLLPLMAAGCAGESVPPSSAEEASSAQTLDTSTSSGSEATSLMTEEISSAGAESTRRSDPSVTAARTMEPTSRPTTAPVSTSSVSTATTAKTPPEGFLTQALFAAGRDAYGSKSINILGDSISHGANAPNIPEDSYVGLLKKAVAQKFGAHNYGFTSLLCTFSNPSGLYQELHTIDTQGAWSIVEGTDAGDHLGFRYYRSAAGNGTADMTFTVERGSQEVGRYVRGVYVYYEAGPHQGSFRVEVNGKQLATVDCRQEKRDPCARSSYIPLPTDLKGRAKIRLIKEPGDSITITGMGYAEDPNGVTVQNYSRSGLQLVEVSDEVIQSVCRANVLILALGFNDAGMQADHVAFRNKIDKVIQGCEAAGTKLVVVDTLWTFAEKKEFYRAQLQRAADELDGLYITFTDLVEKNPTMIQDTAHPTVEGHKLVATRICERLGLPAPK